MQTSKPLVVIRCLTFNHEAYIRDTIEGFIMQKTTFPFVAIIHDDASTDGTASIIEKYASKYPDIIKPIIEKENQYSKHDGSLRRIINQACENTGAKYVAMCEGDDYWTDSDKLQMQVDFLESHPDYSMCFHRVDIIDQDTSRIDSGCSVVESKDYEHHEMQSRLNVPTCSTVFRIECILNSPADKDFIVGDNVLWATCRSMGKVRGFDRVMGVYRRVSTGWTAQFTKLGKQKYYDLNFAWIKHRQAMKRHFPDIKPQILDKIIMENMAIISILDARIYHRNFSKNFKQFYSEYGIRYVGAIAKVIANSASNKVKAFLHCS